MSQSAFTQKVIGGGYPSSTTPVTSVTIPVGGNPSANSAMTINVRQSNNFLFGLSANVISQMNCFSIGGGNIPWAVASPNSWRLGGTSSQIMLNTAEFIAAAFGGTLNTAFATANDAILNGSDFGNSLTGASINLVQSNIGSVIKPMEQFGTLSTPYQYVIDGLLIDPAPHDSLVAYSVVQSGVGSTGTCFAKKTGNTYSDFFFTPGYTPIYVSCTNSLADASVQLLATALGITPTSAVFATNTGGGQAQQGSLGTWNNVSGPSPTNTHILISLTV